MANLEKIEKLIEIKFNIDNVIFLCIDIFPQFREDFEILWQNKIITVENDRFKWNYSLTSLGEYFYLRVIDYKDKYIWAIIEPSFGLKRNTLTHLVNNNGREFKREVSRDYEKIIDLFS
jgi:glycyl-tRNA synthetase (class II)